MESFIAKAFVLFLAGLFVLGAGMLGEGVYSAYRAHEMESWPFVHGVITTVEETTSPEPFSPGWLRRQRYRSLETVTVSCDYSVGGRQYSGSRMRMTSEVACMSKYLVGMTVEVFYSPDDPANSVLQRGVYTESCGDAILGCAVMATPLVVVALATVSKRRKRRVGQS